MFKTVEIKVIQIICERVDGDPGNELEVYGSLGANVGNYDDDLNYVVRQGKFLWQREDDNYVNISPGNPQKIEGDNSFKFDMSEGDHFQIGGQLAEYDDSSANDELGHPDKTFNFNSIPDNHILTFEGGEPNGQMVKAEFSFSVITHWP
ncbi:hypothetical protein QF028_002089 [Neobacillus sp. B4I6]|uniref:hypothetical protein n=1 Tax=Neobacillus sp. B4I6 TaxID=3373925 RepID=UPI003D1DF8A1